ncbi:hypothetical protein UAW_02949 [Enterococcus haemoperoxidus ATCC BAA-382]|uniref:Uncharacterized protein n=1 Tax=Enterococcus haemoperoxidus ATCC BAA-382 TaxID=1158608 RepID=R2QCF5_9ENTE|nr:hypothetical protein UAW_02949 [Enterococcus haemoperoxidus ATCC BAA-382]EOT61651.1 hypothetical protein I583_00633 [Enterococcus haemoperoxidus ATCC BAA-382]
MVNVTTLLFLDSSSTLSVPVTLLDKSYAKEGSLIKIFRLCSITLLSLVLALLNFKNNVIL